MKKISIVFILLGFFVASNAVVCAKSNHDLSKEQCSIESCSKPKSIKVYSEGKIKLAKNTKQKFKNLVHLRSYSVEHGYNKSNDEFKQSEKKLKKTSKVASQSTNARYMPYLQFGGTRFFRVQNSQAAVAADLFIPLWQHNLTDLIFTDLRINDYTGRPIEGNIHLGYRHLFLETQQLLGGYLAFDRRKTQADNYFNQLTLGGEYWIKKFFIGANIYKPIGNTLKTLWEVNWTNSSVVGDQVFFRDDSGPYFNVFKVFGVKEQKRWAQEKVLPGFDAEIGYEFVPGLTGYLGGYYFRSSDTDDVFGQRARLTWNWVPANGERILGVFDKFGLETGVQRDSPRGAIWYLSANLRLGWFPRKKLVLKGVARHMLDQVRRDPDIVAVPSENHETIEKKDEEMFVGRGIRYTGDAAGFNGFVKDIWTNHPEITHIDVNTKIGLQDYQKIYVGKEDLFDAIISTLREKPIMIVDNGYGFGGQGGMLASNIITLVEDIAHNSGDKLSIFRADDKPRSDEVNIEVWW